MGWIESLQKAEVDLILIIQNRFEQRKAQKVENNFKFD